MIVSKALSITTSFSDSDSFHFERNHQAVKIQSIVRGWQARKAFLPGSFYPLYEEACQETVLRLMPKAKEGKTPVYLPSHLPEIVLKQSGGLKAKQRFHQMQAIRKILKEKKCYHLTVPEAAVHGNFIVERRLPIDTDPYQNVLLYEENQSLFDEPVREMVRLFSRSYINGLVIFKRDRILGTACVFESIERIRYDNLSFYKTIENGKPKIRIALIDLERAGQSVRPDPYKMLVLAALFPRHSEIIRDEAKKNEILCDTPDTIKSARLGIDYMGAVSANFLGFPIHWQRYPPELEYEDPHIVKFKAGMG